MKSKVASGTKFLSNTYLTTTQAKNIWKDMFKTQRGKNCKPPTVEEVKPRQGEAASRQGANSAWGVSQPSTSWIKKWGFGSVAYLIDFLDSVFLEEFKKECLNILKDISARSNKETKEAKDPFDLKLLPSFKNNPLKTDADYAKLGPQFNKKVYEGSFNTIQLKSAVKNWGWYHPEEISDLASELIVSYDFNGDGRLSPRELIMAAIFHNAKSHEELLCYNCFFLMRKKLDAIFFYFDCSAKGYITAEELWNKLPELKRKDNDKYNLFSAGSSDTIRTNAVNDFILKNSKAVDGGITKNELTLGILLGFWDRQTTDTEIIGDDKRSLKKLRWTKDGKVDIVATKYIQAKKEMEAKAK